MAADLRRLAAEAYINTGQAEKVLDLVPEGAVIDPRLALLVAEAQNRTGNVGEAIDTLGPKAERLLGVSGSRAPTQNA